MEESKLSPQQQTQQAYDQWLESQKAKRKPHKPPVSYEQMIKPVRKARAKKLRAQKQARKKNR